jgi:hypothetical protein
MIVGPGEALRGLAIPFGAESFLKPSAESATLTNVCSPNDIADQGADREGTAWT